MDISKNLTRWLLFGLISGVGVGLFFGEYASVLSVIGDAFVGLLQMTVLPYMAIAIVANIGRLSPALSKRFTGYALTFLSISTLLTLTAIVLLPLCLPDRKSGAFFSSSALAEPGQIDFLKLFIPANPFHSLANNIVPAVVLFCIALGVAIMTLENKKVILSQLDFLTEALARVNKYLVMLTPIGVFAIVASICGTMHLDELTNLKAYVVLNAVASLVLGYGVLMVLLSALTPFSYRDLFRVSRAPVLTAFVTGKVFIVLPMLIESGEELFSKQFPKPEDAISNIRAVTPLVYPFPHAGKLLALLFVPFAGWFADIPLSLNQYPMFLGSGLFSLFGSPLAAMPFLLDMFELPADMFQLFVASGVLVSRMGDLLGAIHLLFVAVLTATALSGRLQFNLRRVLLSLSFVVVLGAVAIGGTRAYLASTLSQEYNRDEIVKNMHLALHSTDAVVHRTIPVNQPIDTIPALTRILNGGVLRIGYLPDNLPMSFFNASGELVGYDIDMAHILARQTGCKLEFVPFELGTLVEQLDRSDFDIAMAVMAMLPHRIVKLSFVESHMNLTLALLVRDHRREEIAKLIAERDFSKLRIGVNNPDDVNNYAATVLPGAEFVATPSIRDYLESGGTAADGIAWAAESGSAWTLLYPGFSVVPIRPIYHIPAAYSVAKENVELADFMSQWVQVIMASPASDQLYDHWILGKSAHKPSPRWSIIRDVLHWVD